MPGQSSRQLNNKKHYLAGLAIAVALVFVGVGIFESISSTPTTRTVASINKNAFKQKQLQVSTEKYRKTHKLSAPFKVKISSVNDEPYQIGQPYPLRATIISTLPLNDLAVQWILPPTVNLVEGELLLNIGNLPPHEPREVFLTVISTSEAIEKVLVKIKSDTGTTQMAQIGRFKLNPNQNLGLNKLNGLGLDVENDNHSKKTIPRGLRKDIRLAE